MTIVSFAESSLYDDLEAYSSFMYSILEEMRELADKYGRKTSDRN